MPRSPPPTSSDRRWPARYPPRERDRLSYRDYDDYDYPDHRDRDRDRERERERDRRERDRDEYEYEARSRPASGRPLPPSSASSSFGRVGTRDRSPLVRRVGVGRKRSPSPSPRSIRSQYSPPPPSSSVAAQTDERDPRSRYSRPLDRDRDRDRDRTGGRTAYDYPPPQPPPVSTRRPSSPRRASSGLNYSHAAPTTSAVVVHATGTSAAAAAAAAPGQSKQPPPAGDDVGLENGEYSEEEGMVTPPLLKKRKMEAQVQQDEQNQKQKQDSAAVQTTSDIDMTAVDLAPNSAAASVGVEEPRKSRLVLVSAPSATPTATTTTAITATASTVPKRVVDSPPHQSRTAIVATRPTTDGPQLDKPAEGQETSGIVQAEAAQKVVEPPKVPLKEEEVKPEPTVSGDPSALPTRQQPSPPAVPAPATGSRGRSRSPIKISLPSISLGVKKAGNTSTAAGFPSDPPRGKESMGSVPGARGVAGDSITIQPQSGEGARPSGIDALPSVPPPSARPTINEARQASPPFPPGMSFSARERERERRERYDDSRYASRYPSRGSVSSARARGRPVRGRGGYGAPYERYGREMERDRGGAAGRRYSTSRSWSRSRSPVRSGGRMARSPRSRSRSSSPPSSSFRPRLRSVSRGPRDRPAGRYRSRSPLPRMRSRSRSVLRRSSRSVRSDSRSRSRTRTISRSPRSRSPRSRSPRSPAIPTAPSSFRRNVRPPTGPAAESGSLSGNLERDGRLTASSSYAGGLTASVSGSTAGSASRGGYIPTGPSGGFGRGRGRGGPPIAPRAPRAERLGYAVAGVPPAGPSRPPVVSSLVQPVHVDRGPIAQDGAAGGLSHAPSESSVPTPAPVSTQQPDPVQKSSATTVRTELVERPVSQDIPAIAAPSALAATPALTVESTAELMADRESKIKIQFKRDSEGSTAPTTFMAPPERPTIKENAALVAPPHKLPASSPVAPALSGSSPATPLEGKITASPKIGSSPLDTGALTPGKVQLDRRTDVRPTQHPPASTPIRRPSHITLPPPSNLTPQARSRASSSAVPPTPGVRTPHPQQPGPTSMLRHSTSYARPAPLWKEYSPPAELHVRDRPSVADVMDVLHAVLPNNLSMNEDYAARRGGGLADRDMTRVAGEWEKQLAKLQHERVLVTHAFQSLASGLRIKKFEMGNALDEVWVAERKVEAAGMTMETAVFSPKRE